MSQIYVADAYIELQKAVDNLFIYGEKVDFILTDPLYNLTKIQKHIFHSHFDAIARNGYVVFSPEQNPFMPLAIATYNSFWIKPLSTKNYKVMRRPSKFVELIQYKYDTENKGNHTWNAKDLHWSMSTNVYTDIVHHNTLHMYRKPLSMIKRLIKLHTDKGDLILDPFMGSGVVAEACIELGRNFICFDIDEELVKKTKERLGL